jgi:hypothetical protein
VERNEPLQGLLDSQGRDGTTQVPAVWVLSQEQDKCEKKGNQKLFYHYAENDEESDEKNNDDKCYNEKGD